MQDTEQSKSELTCPTEVFRPATSSAGTILCRLTICVCALVAVAVGSRAQPAQVPEPPLPVDPTPLAQLISAAEKAMLDDANNPRKLAETYLKISDNHVQASLSAIKANNHTAAERELDIYNKAVAEAWRVTFALRDGKRSVSKKVEQLLYKQIKTLETIDRLFPAEREAFSDAALKHAKQVRVQALNEAFASGGVLKDPGEEKKPDSEPPDKDPPSKNPEREPDTVSSTIREDPKLRFGEFIRPSPLRINQLVTNSKGPFARAGLQVPGDYLTEEEDDHVREAQAADARAKVFMKIADRRIKLLSGPAAPPTDKKDQKKAEEEEKEWGTLPKLSRAELLRHYARAISECMAKLEDAYERNPKSSALPKALAILRESTDKHLQVLRTLQTEMKGESEEAALRGAVDEAETANKGARAGLK
jgi:hypothetical protein